MKKVIITTATKTTCIRNIVVGRYDEENDLVDVFTGNLKFTFNVADIQRVIIVNDDDTEFQIKPTDDADTHKDSMRELVEKICG